MIRTLAAVLLLAGAPLAQAHAWGSNGHRTIASIASGLMTPNAHAQVTALLANDPEGRTDLDSASTWADDIGRRRPTTGAWHYVNAPVTAAAYIAERDCPTGECSLGALDRFVGILRDQQSLPAARAEALKWVVHVVGDMHQPLHAGDAKDRGGNDVRIILNGRATNLHAIWDIDVVDALMTVSDVPLADRLIQTLTPIQAAAWERDLPTAWTAEAHAIARDIIYPAVGNIQGGTSQPIIIGPESAVAQGSVVRIQLLRAGVRLAAVLNSIPP